MLFSSCPVCFNRFTLEGKKWEQECILVECVPPARYRMGDLCDRDPQTLDRDPSDPGQRPSLDRDPPECVATHLLNGR